MIDPKTLELRSDDVLLSKINGKKYSTFGNFIKHLTACGISFEEYMQLHYSQYLPLCLETGKLSDYRVQGYWNRWYPITKIHRKLLGHYKNNERAKLRVRSENLYTKFLENSFWLEKGYTFSQTLKIIHWLIRKKFYKKLHDSFYDDFWTETGKERYIKSILELRPLQIGTLHSLNGLRDRGNNEDDIHRLLKSAMVEKKPYRYSRLGLKFEGYTDDHEIDAVLAAYYANKPTVFRDSEYQKRNNQKRQEKYTPEEQKKFSVRCVEYWLERGYDSDTAKLKVSESQQLNTLENIQKRFNCTLEESEQIQQQIYEKRKQTFEQKSEEELSRIYKSQDSKSFNYCLKKCAYDVELATELYEKLLKSRAVPFGKASKESLKYFIPMFKFLRKRGVLREDIYFGIGGSSEYYIFDKNTKKLKFYDFTILSKKLIIEYDGVFWHSSEKSIENDKFKTELCERHGFTLLRIKSETTFTENNNLIYDFVEKYL
jgi:hypothetical protein